MCDAIGIAEIMLGLPGFHVLDAGRDGGLLTLEVETLPGLVGCVACGVVGVGHGRVAVTYHDLPAFGRPTRLVWRKRRYRCMEPACMVETWTERSELLGSRCILTRRAGVWCCREVGVNACSVSKVARELGVAWHTVMDAVHEYGEPLVQDPERIGQTRALGVDETTWLSATNDHGTMFVTSLVDLDRRVVIDVTPGNSAKALTSWIDTQPHRWLTDIQVVPTDLTDSYRSALERRRWWATRVADPFHVVWLRTAASRRSAAACSSKHSDTAAANATTSTRSGSCWCVPPRNSTDGVSSGCLAPCTSAIPTMRYSPRGRSKKPSATSTSPTTTSAHATSSTPPSPPATTTPSRRSRPSAEPSSGGATRSCTTTSPARATARPKP